MFGIIVPRLFGMDITSESVDQNPGTANAFQYGSFWCGVLTLVGDVLKGFIPVLLYRLYGEAHEVWVVAAIMLAAPVIGHILPVFFGFRGGKGLATAFGCLLAVAPGGAPCWILCALFIIFSLVVKISPNFYRTIVCLLCALPLIAICRFGPDVLLGYVIIMAAMLIRLAVSDEEKEKWKVSFLWTH